MNMRLEHTCVSSNFSKSEDQCSFAMMQAANKAFANNCNHFKTMTTVVKAYIHKREYSAQEVVHHSLPELYLCLRGLFQGLFWKLKFGRKSIKILQSEELGKIPDDSANIFKQKNID